MRKPLKQRRVRAQEQHADGWANYTTGIGVLGRDKRLGGTFATKRLSYTAAGELWQGDDVCGRLVEQPVDAMLAPGHRVLIEGSKGLAADVEAYADRLEVIAALREALCYGRALGGGALLLGIDDGGALDQPLAEDRIRSFDWINVLEPIELTPVRWYADAKKTEYRRPKAYHLRSFVGAPAGAKPIEVHESRVIRISGVQTTGKARNEGTAPGWDDSVFVRVAQVVHDYQSAWQGTSILLSDFAAPTLRIKGLTKLLAGQRGAATLARRVAAVELCRSISRAMVIDGNGDEYKRETVPVAGLADLLDLMSRRLALAMDMPASLLMGQRPATSELRFYQGAIEAMRQRTLAPALARLYTLMFLSRSGPSKGRLPKNWSVRFNAASPVSALEVAQARLATAQADRAHIEARVVTPAEVAKSRYGGGSYSAETQINKRLR